MIYASVKNSVGLDMNATAARISEMINESGLSDKQLGEIMNLSVQSINKWRHGYNLPDIENMYILSRILGKKVDDLLVPLAIIQPMLEVEIEERKTLTSMMNRLKESVFLLKGKYSTFRHYQCSLGAVE